MTSARAYQIVSTAPRQPYGVFQPQRSGRGPCAEPLHSYDCTEARWMRARQRQGSAREKNNCSLVSYRPASVRFDA